MKKSSSWIQSRKENAKKKFETTKILQKSGLNATQISNVLKTTGFPSSKTATVKGYMKYKTYEDFAQSNKAKQEAIKRKKAATVSVVSPLKEVVEKKDGGLDANITNLNKALDLVAEAYDMLVDMKAGIK